MTTTNIVTLTLPTLHKKQQLVYNSKARFKILSCGRQWGKTSLVYVMAVECAVKGGVVWWVAPTSSIAGIGWRLLQSNLKDVPGVEIHITEKRIYLPTGGEIWIKSADNPDGLRGATLDLIIVDEAAYIKDEVWYEVLMPMLAIRQGKAVFISTPKGVGGYFHELYLLGQDTNEIQYESWKFPSSSNPYMPIEEVERAKKRLTRLTFQQEWLAEFVADGESVFKNIDELCCLEIESARLGGYYVGGLDWGGKNDPTVLSIFDATNRKQVDLMRTFESDFETQYELIENKIKEYGISRVLVEENAIGQAPFQALRNRGLPVIPFVTSNASKYELVSKTVHAMDTKKILLLNNEILKGEMKIFEQTRTTTGLWRFAAKGKGHDDTVVATMLAISLLDTADMYVPLKMVYSVPRTQMKREYSEHEKQKGGAYAVSHGINK